MEPDPRLVLLARLLESIDVETTQQGFGKDNSESSEQYRPVEVSLMAVTIFLPGIVVSGSPVSVNTYSRRIRDLAKGSNELTKTLLDSLFANDDKKPSEDELSQIEYTRLYLIDCYLTNGTSNFTLPQLRVELGKVTAWTPGRLEAQ